MFPKLPPVTRALLIANVVVFLLQQAGVQEQSSARKFIRVLKDVEVRQGKVTRDADIESFKEADLQGHLGNGNGGADRPSGKAVIGARKVRPQDDDFQVGQALSLLKGLSVTRGN